MVALQFPSAPKLGWKRRPAVYGESISWMRLLMTMALFSVATGAILVGLESRPVRPAPQLGLRTTTRSQQVEIRWDHASLAVLNPVNGLMKITEGDSAKLIPLGRRDFQDDGYVSYKPRTNDVRVSLEVTGADGSKVSESARVVAIP